MILNAKNRGFYEFFGDFKLRHTFQERQHSREMVAPSSIYKYIVPNVSCRIDELRSVRSRPSNMHRCHAFPSALTGLFLLKFTAKFSDFPQCSMKKRNTRLPSGSWSCRRPVMIASLFTWERSSPSIIRESKAVYVMAICPLSCNTGDRRACKHHILSIFTKPPHQHTHICHSYFYNHNFDNETCLMVAKTEPCKFICHLCQSVSETRISLPLSLLYRVCQIMIQLVFVRTSSNLHQIW